MRRRSAKVTLSATYLALAGTVGAGVLAGCSTGNDDQVYCGDEHRQVLPVEECEDDDGVGVIYVGAYGAGGKRYQVGDTLPSIKGGQTARANDSAARTRVGVPARGGFGGNGATVSSGG